MVVISLINGSMISETSAIYAAKYAHKLGYSLELIHLRENDEISEVEQSVSNIEKFSNNYDLDCEFTILESINELKNHIQKRDVDIVFSSTRHKHSIRESSFVKLLIKQKIKVDLAVVKVVRIGAAQSVDKIILPMRGSQLSVKKFTLFSTFASMFEAKSEIYSVDKISKMSASKLDIIKEKKRLKKLIFELRHYFRLIKLLNFHVSLKHDYALQESDVVQSHIADGDYDLAIIGTHNEKSFFASHPIDILFENPLINIIYFIPSGDES